MRDATFELHEMLKPLAGELVMVRSSAGEALGPITMAIREDDGDHVFTVADVSFVADNVASIDFDSQLVVLHC